MTDQDKKSKAPCLDPNNEKVKDHKYIELDIEHCQLMFNNGYAQNYVRPGIIHYNFK